MGMTETFARGLRSKPMKKPDLLLFITLIGPLAGCTHSQRDARAESRQTASVARKEYVVSCPDGDIKKTGTNDHKVSLSWQPSKTAMSEEIRYCLYRTEDHRVQKSGDRLPIRGAPCKGCTRVNEEGVWGTFYTDTQVRNGAQYCYVAVAVEIGNGKFSEFSNQVQVDIPEDPTPLSPAQSSSGHLCDDKEPSPKPRSKPLKNQNSSKNVSR